MATFKLFFYCISLLALEKVVYAYSNQTFKFSSNYYAKSTALDCMGNPDLVTNITCKIRAINWEHSKADLDADLLGSLRNISVRLELFKYTNQFRPFLINFTVNGCEVLKTGRIYGYQKAAYDIFLKYSNVNHTCPYSGHLAAKGLFVDFDYFKFGMPTGKYKFAFNFFEGWPWVYIGTIALTASVEKKMYAKRIAKKLYNTNRTLIGSDKLQLR